MQLILIKPTLGGRSSRAAPRHPRPPFSSSSSVSTMGDVQLISDGPAAVIVLKCCPFSLNRTNFSFTQWHFLFLFGPSDACVFVYRKTRHTHVSSSNLSWHLFIFQRFRICSLSWRWNQPGKVQIPTTQLHITCLLSVQPCRIKIQQLFFFLLNINFKRCFHEL